MDDAEADRAWIQLSRAIGHAVSLLEASGETFWADWLRDARRRLLAYGEDGLPHLLSAVGDVGGLSDVRLSDAHGHRLVGSDWDEVNSRLQELAAQIRAAGSRLQHLQRATAQRR